MLELVHSLNTTLQEVPRESSIVQAVWLACVILFIVGVATAGFTAKRIQNLHNPTYSKAFLAQIILNPMSLAVFMYFAFFFQAPLWVALLIAYSLVPIVIFRLTFSCAMWREAALIWIVTFVVQGAVGFALAMVGILRIAAIIGT
jgi:hypothetical protein